MKEPTEFYKNYCSKCIQNDNGFCSWGEQDFPPTETKDCIYPKMYPQCFLTEERTDKTMNKVIFRDEAQWIDNYYVNLTDDQIRLLKWLKDKDILLDEITFEIVSDKNFEEI